MEHYVRGFIDGWESGQRTRLKLEKAFYCAVKNLGKMEERIDYLQQELDADEEEIARQRRLLERQSLGITPDK